jgi:NAD(P)-dependent dehydrogenase (short-subunit alcohol dehydrogenase family)
MSYRPPEVDLSGRVAVVTGANRGMGQETARELARVGADLVLACRSTDRGETAKADIMSTTGATAITVMEIDLSSPPSVRAFATALARRFATVDVLVNNAAASLQTREATPEGVERTCATNVLGPHLLTTLLVPALRASGHGRIVNVSTRVAGGLDLSDVQYERRRYSAIGAYRASKQASRMLTWALVDRLEGQPVTANALNPGYVLTELTRNATGWLKVLVALTSFTAQSPLDGADTAIWLAASPEVEGVTARFWSKRREIACQERDKPVGNGDLRQAVGGRPCPGRRAEDVVGGQIEPDQGRLDLGRGNRLRQGRPPGDRCPFTARAHARSAGSCFSEEGGWGAHLERAAFGRPCGDEDLRSGLHGACEVRGRGPRERRHECVLAADAGPCANARLAAARTAPPWRIDGDRDDAALGPVPVTIGRCHRAAQRRQGRPVPGRTHGPERRLVAVDKRGA